MTYQHVQVSAVAGRVPVLAARVSKILARHADDSATGDAVGSASRTLAGLARKDFLEPREITSGVRAIKAIPAELVLSEAETVTVQKLARYLVLAGREAAA